MTNVLLLHGNGGSTGSFAPLLNAYERFPSQDLRFFVPELSGFDQKPLPESDDYFELFWTEISEMIGEKTVERWVVYGHGFGASLILELAARNWTLPNGYIFKPQKCILHACPGYDKVGFHAGLAKFKPFDSIAAKLLVSKIFRNKWNNRLFGAKLPDAQVLDKFYQDIKNTPGLIQISGLTENHWLTNVQKKTWHNHFVFWIGEQDKIASTKYLDNWKGDFPKSSFKVMEEWMHYPMLTGPYAFLNELYKEIKGR